MPWLCAHQAPRPSILAAREHLHARGPARAGPARLHRAALLQRGRARAARDRADLHRDGQERAQLRTARHRRRLDRPDTGQAAPGRTRLPQPHGHCLPPQRRRRHRPPHRHPAGQGRHRGLDRRRPDLPERAHPRVRRDPRRGPDHRPGGGRAHQRGRHAQGLPRAGQMVRAQAGRTAHQRRHPRPELGPAGVPALGRAALPQAAAPRVLLRHNDHAGVPVQRARGALRPHRLRQARGTIEVPLLLRRLPVRAPGTAHGDVLQPAQGADAARPDAAHPRRAQGHLRPRGAPAALRQRHDPDLRHRDDPGLAGPAGRPDRPLPRRHVRKSRLSARRTRTRAAAPGTPPNSPATSPRPATT